jgi:aminopeptidase N
MKFNYLCFFILLLVFAIPKDVCGQFFIESESFGRYDTLRGSNTPERAWWDVTYYHLTVDVDIDDKYIRGNNLIRFTALHEGHIMQIDLQEPMKITQVERDGKDLNFEKDSMFYFVDLDESISPGESQDIRIFFEGSPKVAVLPPWDGGFTWTEDSNGKPFVANSNQGIGSSIWWPNKDHPLDEPDSLLMSVTVPEELVNVSNGKLKEVTENRDGTKTWHWKVTNPINNYGVNVNIGDYVNFQEIYAGEKGELLMDYWVLRENAEVARIQFADAPRTIEAFEYWFGPYPFYEDSYKLVEAPYLGMEHQSSVTYGNGYQNGYRGRDLSGSGWGLKFDYIIIHETGHEWFANNITYSDKADMWIHESFTFYSEALFLEYHFGEKAADEYMRGIRFSILNDKPIIGTYGVNREGSSDVYFKGGNMLHTLRQVVDNDSLWRHTLRGLNKRFYHQTVSSEEVEQYIEEKTGLELTAFFDQYLRDHRVPVLEYGFRDGFLTYRWSNVVDGFIMPVKVTIDGTEQWLKPSQYWSSQASFGSGLSIHPDFYTGSMNITGN